MSSPHIAIDSSPWRKSSADMERMVVRVEKLVQGGEGFSIAPDGRALFVAGALPGELVCCDVVQEKKRFIRARTLDVLEPSEDRVAPSCPYYGICGGCNLMHLAHGAQVEAKRSIVLENLRRIGGLSVNDALDHIIEPGNPGESPGFGYRSRVRFHVDSASSSVGFLEAGSEHLVDIGHCPILVPSLDSLLGESRATVLAKAARSGTGGLWHSLPVVPVIAGDDAVSFDDTVVRATVAGRPFFVDAKVFFQSNRHALPALAVFVADHVLGPDVMDLYSGVGTFSAFLEDRGFRVVAVEREPGCLELARRNLTATTFFTGAVERWGKGKRPAVDTVVVDPPRVGLDDAVPAMIASWGPRRVIYVSCDSVTLARDLRRFLQAGYSPSTGKVFDFYPQTSHQETVLVLDRKRGKR
ncbi:MAG: class I SAM-dependent RNA methyltransferase [Sphaerochaetaceae bacterium]|jgi:23S rRNA (uracil1939-C5)-methyltransferase